MLLDDGLRFSNADILAQSCRELDPLGAWLGYTETLYVGYYIFC